MNIAEPLLNTCCALLFNKGAMMCRKYFFFLETYGNTNWVTNVNCMRKTAYRYASTLTTKLYCAAFFLERLAGY